MPFLSRLRNVRPYLNTSFGLSKKVCCVATGKNIKTLLFCIEGDNAALVKLLVDAGADILEGME